MSARVARFQFTVDIDDLITKAQKGEQVLVNLGNAGEQSGTKVATGMDKAGSSVMTAGEKSITAAVKFQTLTQGLLNLSTATAQTYTSLSNLDRAQQRVVLSAIAHERAINTLHTQEARLDKLRSASIPDMDRISVLQDKIATQKDAISAAAENERLAQDQLNDTYILFGSSIANTVFSSIQTISSLKATMALRTTQAAVAQAVENAVTTQNTVAKAGNIAATTALIPTNLALTATNVGLTFSFRALTVAMLSNPLGIALIAGSIAALALYETNVFGVKDAVDKMIGSFGTVTPAAEGFTGELNRGTGAMTQYSSQADHTAKSIDAMSEKADKAFWSFEKLHKSITQPLGEDPFGLMASEAGGVNANIDPRLDSDFMRARRFMGNNMGAGRGQIGSVLESDLREQDKLINNMISSYDLFIKKGYDEGEVRSHILNMYKDEASQLGLQNKLLDQQLGKHIAIEKAKDISHKKDQERKKKTNRDLTLDDITIVDGVVRTWVHSQHQLLENTKRLLDGIKGEDERTVQIFSGLIRKNQVILDNTFQLAGILGLQAVADKIKKTDYVGAKMLDELIRRGNLSIEEPYLVSHAFPHTSLAGFNIDRSITTAAGDRANGMTAFALSMAGVSNTIQEARSREERQSIAARALFNQRGVNRSSLPSGAHRIGVSSTSGGRAGRRGHSPTSPIQRYGSELERTFGDLISSAEISQIMTRGFAANRAGYRDEEAQLRSIRESLQTLYAQRQEAQFVSRYGYSTAQARDISSRLGIQFSEFTEKRGMEATFNEIDDRLRFKERYDAMSTGLVI